jgi:hypothetical protein
VRRETVSRADLPAILRFAGRFSEIAGRANPVSCQISNYLNALGEFSRLKEQGEFFGIAGKVLGIAGTILGIAGRRAAWNCEWLAGFGAGGTSKGA